MCTQLGQVNDDNINTIPNAQCFSTIKNQERERNRKCNQSLLDVGPFLFIFVSHILCSVIVLIINVICVMRGRERERGKVLSFDTLPHVHTLVNVLDFFYKTVSITVS